MSQIDHAMTLPRNMANGNLETSALSDVPLLPILPTLQNISLLHFVILHRKAIPSYILPTDASPQVLTPPKQR